MLTIHILGTHHVFIEYMTEYWAQADQDRKETHKKEERRRENNNAKLSRPQKRWEQSEEKLSAKEKTPGAKIKSVLK